MTDARDLVSVASDAGEGQSLVHGSCVSDGGRAVLIIGGAGRGKSSLALQLMAYGADLVADDQTIVEKSVNGLRVSAPETTRGLVEARSVGILRAKPVLEAALSLVVDMDQLENDRLPHPREVRMMGVNLPLIFNVDAPYFAAAVLQFLRHGRNA